MSNTDSISKKSGNGKSDIENEQEYFEDVAETNLLDESMLSETDETPESQSDFHTMATKEKQVS